jgi:hypothetical protein
LAGIDPDVLATLTAKTVPIPIGRNGFGLAIAGVIVYDPLNQTGSGLIINVPMSFEHEHQPIRPPSLGSAVACG